jgi:hypothetical protein
MKSSKAQTTRTTIVLLTVASFLISLTPHVPAKPTAPARKQAEVAATPSSDAARMRAREAYGKLPLSFEPNQGQTDHRVKFLTRGPGYTVFLTATEAVLRLSKYDKGTESKEGENARTSEQSTLRMKLLGARSTAQIAGESPLQGKSNYLVGNDRKQWHTDIPTFSKVRYSAVYPGIDMVYYGTSQRQLEYDFIVAPGADPARIRVQFDGAEKLSIDEAGNLLLATKAGELTQRAPVIYQETGSGRQTVVGRYVISDAREVGFTVGAFDATKPLVIDPQLVYSTYLGGGNIDVAHGIAMDSGGNAYIAGETQSDNFPVTNVVDANAEPRLTTAFVTKLNAAGTGIVYSTIIGSGFGFFLGNDFLGTQAKAIAVTSDGKACITGNNDNTGNRSDFPVTSNAYQKNGIPCLFACGVRPDRVTDAFVTVLNPQGNGLVYSTFFGGSALDSGLSNRGSDSGEAIAVDSANRVYITGLTASNNLPTKNAFQILRQSSLEGTDAFVAVFDPTAASGNDTLLYSSFLGGRGDDVGKGIAVDAANNAYVVGSTASTDLDTKSPAGQSLPPLRANFQGGATDGFVAKIDTESSGNPSLTYLTYFGGNLNDRVEAVAVDSAQRVYITGASNSSAISFPLLNAFDSTQTNGEAFVAKLNANGTALFYSSFLGGNNGNTANDGEEGLGLVIDAGGNAYVTGRTTSGASFPVGAVAPPFPTNLQGTAFVAKIEASNSSTTPAKLLYSSTFGGSGAKAEAIALDRKGNVYLAGSTNGNLPTTTGAFQTSFNGGSADGFVAKIGTTFNDTIGVFRPSTNQFLFRNSNTAGAPDITTTFGQPGDQPIVGDWNGDGTDDVGVFRPSTGQFLLRQIGITFVRPCPLCVPIPQVTIITTTVNFGTAGDLAVVGDWNGDGIDTPGVLRPSTGEWFLSNGPSINNTTLAVDLSFSLGQLGDTPLVGDWNGDGIETVGVFQKGSATFILSNDFNGTNDVPPFTFGQLGSLPLSGDWNGDGIDTIGVFNPNTGVMALNNTNTSGTGIGDLVFNFGQNGDVPLAGDWDGKPLN